MLHRPTFYCSYRISVINRGVEKKKKGTEKNNLLGSELFVCEQSLALFVHLLETADNQDD